MSAKKMTTENKLLYGGVALAGIAGIIALVSSGGSPKKLGEGTFEEPVKPTTPTPTPSNTSGNSTSYTPAPVKPVVLNKNLILRVGSVGNEVKELQKLLGVSTDGNFGPKTQAALISKKGVSEITLAKFATTPNVNNNVYPVGAKLMATPKAGAKVYGNKVLVDGSSMSTGEVYKTVPFGEYVGIVKGKNPQGTWYRIAFGETNWLGQTVYTFGWVIASEVKNY